MGMGVNVRNTETSKIRILVYIHTHVIIDPYQSVSISIVALIELTRRRMRLHSRHNKARWQAMHVLIKMFAGLFIATVLHIITSTKE